MQPQSLPFPGTSYLFPGVELHLTSPLCSADRVYSATGFVRLESAHVALEGSSVRIRSLATGLTEEAFLNANGSFAQEVELQPELDNPLEFSVCDGVGREIARVVVVVQRPGRAHEKTAPSARGSAGASPSLAARKDRSPMLDPPWPRFAQLVQRCLNLAAEVADKTGRDLDELCDHIRAQQRYAEQAYEERNPTLYHECKDNLEKYRGYLAQLLSETSPRLLRPGPSLTDEARAAIDRFRASLSAVWKQVRQKHRADLEARLGEIAALARGLSQRSKDEPFSVVQETNRLSAEIEQVAERLGDKQPHISGSDAELLR